MTLFLVNGSIRAFSEPRPEWPTPAGVFEALNATYYFALDACATRENARVSTVLHTRSRRIATAVDRKRLAQPTLRA